MALGDVHLIAKHVHNMTSSGLAALWGTNLIKCAFVTSALTPSGLDSDPRWGGGGAQNYASSEVTPGGNYVAGGFALSGTTVTFGSGLTNLNATSPLIVVADSANPPNARWGIVYDATDAGKHVYGFIDLGGITTLVIGLQFNINGVAAGGQPLFQGSAP